MILYIFILVTPQREELHCDKTLNFRNEETPSNERLVLAFITAGGLFLHQTTNPERYHVVKPRG